MALRRSYGKKRKGGRRRTSRRSRRTTMYKRLLPRNRIFYFNRYSFYQAPQVALTTDANGQYFGAMFAQGIELIYTDISSVVMPNRSEFTSLFDQYKILSYTIELRPRFDNHEIATAGAHLPTIYWVYDQDDASAPTGMSQLMEHPKVRSAVLRKPVYITVKYPTTSGIEYNGGLITSGYSVARSPWLDCNSYQVPHYGVKYAIQGSPTTNYTGVFDIRVKWRLAFKNPR